MAIRMTLVLVRQGEKVLLGKKKLGLGKGNWNGFGGKVEAGETLEEAARRELTEEAGIIAGELRKFAEFHFSFADGSFERIAASAFEVREFQGEPRESDEMLPRWFSLEKIPFDEMWDDDRLWFPLFLSGKSFEGRFVFRKGKVIEHRIEERVY